MEAEPLHVSGHRYCRLLRRQRLNVGPDFVRGAQNLGVVELTSEADFAARLNAVSIDDVS